MKLSPIFGLPIAEPTDARRDFPTQVDEPRTTAIEEALHAAAPPGVIHPYAGTAAPAGWLLCQGQAVSRTDYAALYAVCGTTYGVGDGSTTFNVPNLKGRVAAGIDSAQTEFNARGTTGGAKTHQHRHISTTMWAAAIKIIAPSSAGNLNYQGSTYTKLDTSPIYTREVTAGSTEAATDRYLVTSTPESGLQPYIALHYIIRAI